MEPPSCIHCYEEPALPGEDLCADCVGWAGRPVFSCGCHRFQLTGFAIASGRVLPVEPRDASLFAASITEAERFTAGYPTLHDIRAPGGTFIRTGLHEAFREDPRTICACGETLRRFIIVEDRIRGPQGDGSGFTHFCVDTPDAERIQADQVPFHDVRERGGQLHLAGTHRVMKQEVCPWPECKRKVVISGQGCPGHEPLIEPLVADWLSSLNRRLESHARFYDFLVSEGAIEPGARVN